MNNLQLTIISISFFSLSMVAPVSELWIDHVSTVSTTDNQTKGKMKITIGSKVFTATLSNTKAADAFKAKFPLNIRMEDLNKNEKFYYLPENLPVSSSPGGKIQAGDLMLYGNKCVVIFYKDLQTSYSYTRLGRIDNSAELVAALGSGDVNVKFEL